MFIFRKKWISVICLTLCSTAALANCPDPSAVKFGCIVVQGEKHCAWSAPWYEGYTDDKAQPGESAASFNQAFWGVKGDLPKACDATMQGSSVCFYNSREGNLIELSQNDWGKVDCPIDSNWKIGDWPGKIAINGMTGRVCTDSAGTCNFDYPV